MSKKWLKADLHIHTKEDPMDCISYSAFDVIDYAAWMGYDIISITNHETVTFTDELAQYAYKKGILLIPGAELTIEGKHVLIYNELSIKSNPITSFEDLRSLKKPTNLIIAPHPFFPTLKALRYALIKNIDLFDAVELCHYYCKHMNFNKKAYIVAKKYNLPMVGTSDMHSLKQMGTTYATIFAEKNSDSVIQAIKRGMVKSISSPLDYKGIFRIMMYLKVVTVKSILNGKKNLRRKNT